MTMYNIRGHSRTQSTNTVSKNNNRV